MKGPFNITDDNLKIVYSDNKNFGEASIYFAGLIMILDGWIRLDLKIKKILF